MTDIYGDVAGFKTYWQARGNNAALINADDATILAALLVASEWQDAAFLGQFGGTKVGQRAQVREWPRNSCFDIYGYAVASDVPPREVLAANYEAAARQIVTPGVFFKDYSPSKYKSVSISQAVSVEYAIGSAYDFQTQMPMIAAILAPILTGRGGATFSPLSGAVTRV